MRLSWVWDYGTDRKDFSDMDRMEDGLLVIDKEAGWTSHDVVARLRRILGMKRIGHTGTLDPMATGVLPVVFGKATKLADLIGEGDKVYEVVLRLGMTTDTQDITGQLLSACSLLPDEDRIREAVQSFIGVQLQLPPMYSARKINGKKLYELARQGETVERHPKEICIYDIKVRQIGMPLVSMTVTCSKGTYIRTLCHDLGLKLGCGGTMESLRRVRAGGYRIEESYTLTQVEKAVEKNLLHDIALSVGKILSDYPERVCLPSADRLLVNGNSLERSHLFHEKGNQEECPEELVRMFTSEGKFLGLYQWKKENNRYCPYKMFL